MNKARTIKISAVVAIAAALSVFALTRGKAVEAQEAPAVSRAALTVRTAMLRQDNWSRSMSASGSIIPWQEAIISAQITGLRIAEVMVSIGDHVKQGQLLVTLSNLARSSDTEDEFHAVQGRIVAPDSGIISVANAIVGSTSQPGVELFRLIRKGRMEWRADLTADELMLIRKGMKVEISIGEGRVISGKVRAISPSVNMQTRYGSAYVSIADSSGLIAGAFANGIFDISAGKRALQYLPQSAVLQRGSQTYVLAIDANNHVHEQKVAVGQRNGDRVEIKQGLKANVAVVESGGAFLTEGDVVKVLPQ
ncbi:MAG: efflux RND transporter periplasmic adaptor subunit [Gallionellaceae bacterium]